MAQKILVIDDDLFIREIYLDTLKQAGYEVDQAIDGSVGLNKLQAGGYDLILLDMVMPKISGLEVLNELYANPPTTKNGKIILLTNSSLNFEIKEALEKGAATFLIKADLTPDQLIEKVKNILLN